MLWLDCRRRLRGGCGRVGGGAARVGSEAGFRHSRRGDCENEGKNDLDHGEYFAEEWDNHLAAAEFIVDEEAVVGGCGGER